MNLNRSVVLLPISLAAAAVTGLTALAASKRFAGRKSKDVFRDSTGGCTPDVGHYVDARILVHDIDGTHQGIATVLLRERFNVDADARTDDTARTELDGLGDFNDNRDEATLDLDYDEALRSIVEAVINLALNMAEAEFDEQCQCGDDDCDGGLDLETLHLVAGRKLVEFAITFETAAGNHAGHCKICAAEGTRSPLYLRAQFCRDLADDLLTNFDSNVVNMRGVPIAAAEDVLGHMVEYIEQAHGVPVSTQIERLTKGVAQSIAHKEGHQTPQS
jgi:hypothetical protein